MTDEPTYGLPSVRDPDTGNLKPVDHTYQFQGREVRIKARPPTIAEMDEYENMPDEISWVHDFYPIVEKHLVKPELPPPEETTAQEIICYQRGIMGLGYIGGTELGQDALDELEARAAEEGN